MQASNPIMTRKRHSLYSVRISHHRQLRKLPSSFHLKLMYQKTQKPTSRWTVGNIGLDDLTHASATLPLSLIDGQGNRCKVCKIVSMCCSNLKAKTIKMADVVPYQHPNSHTELCYCKSILTATFKTKNTADRLRQST